MEKINREVFEHLDKLRVSKNISNVCSEEFYEDLEYYEYSISV